MKTMSQKKTGITVLRMHIYQEASAWIINKDISVGETENVVDESGICRICSTLLRMA